MRRRSSGLSGRRAVVVAVGLAAGGGAFVSGMALGGDPAGVARMGALCLALLVGAGLAGWRRRIVLSVAFGLSALGLGAGSRLGAGGLQRAYNTACVDSETTRQEILKQREADGRYPDRPTLSPERWGKVFLHPPLLVYTPTPDRAGFSLECSDGLVMFAGDQDTPMLAFK